MQPAFILAALATAKLIKSSSVEEGGEGKRAALVLRADAGRALDDAWRGGWVDVGLVEAAAVGFLSFFLVIFFRFEFDLDLAFVSDV